LNFYFMIPSVVVSVVAVGCLDTGSLGATLFCETRLSRQLHISYHQCGGERVQRTTAVFRLRDHIKLSLATSLAIHESPFNNIILIARVIYILVLAQSLKSYQLKTPRVLSKPPLSCRSGLTTFPWRIVYLTMFSQSLGKTLASQMHWAALSSTI
jgi:hypothetical protein